MSSYKFKTKRFNVKELFTKATNKDFFNLFQPVIPKIDVTGKIAQVISALTEAVTIWFIVQSELSGANKTIAILASIFAIIIVVAAIEIGGRKALQVFTRVIVWKKLVTGWHWALFVFVGLVTGGLFYQSYTLSSQGIKRTVSGTVEKTVIFDDSPLLVRHDTLTNRINRRYDREKASIINAYNLAYNAKDSELDAGIARIDAKIDQHKKEKRLGYKWANSHIKKQNGIKADQKKKKATTLAQLATEHILELKALEKARATALQKESKRHLAAVAKAEKANDDNDNSEAETAAFWGGLFSNLVGVSISVAFICIVMVEVFRRGAGITIEYVENELPPSLWDIFWKGISNQFYNLTYAFVEATYTERKEQTFSFIDYDDETPTPSGGGGGKQSSGKQVNITDFIQVDEKALQDALKNKAGKQPKMTVLKGTSTSTPTPKTDRGVEKGEEVNSKQALKKPVVNRDSAEKTGKQSEVNSSGKQSSAGKQPKNEVNSKQLEKSKQSQVNKSEKKAKEVNSSYDANKLYIVELHNEICVELDGKIWPESKVLSNLKTNRGYLKKIESGVKIQRKESTVRNNVKKFEAGKIAIANYRAKLLKKKVVLTVSNDDIRKAS